MLRQLRFWKYLLLSILGWTIAGAIALNVDHGLLNVGTHVGIKHHWNTGWGKSYAAYAQTEAPASAPARPDDANPDDPNGSSSELQSFEEVTAGLEKQTGIFTTYSDLQTGKVYLALLPEQLNRNFLLLATLESGLGESGLFRGWEISDLLIQFREVPQDRLQVVVPNTYIRNPDGQQLQQRLLDGSFSDSIIFAIKVVSIDLESQAKLIDLADLLMTRDLANLDQSLSWAVNGYRRNAELSRVSALKVFNQNLELGTTLGYSAGGGTASPLAALFGGSIQGLADERGFALGVRYSLSALPESNGYQPRLADERVGYFLSVFAPPYHLAR
ncbi:MAG: DUF5117 domain-containing protein [Phormidesmis sp. RL_2_1]|nr:DUF5117 domain-containing protein [Phormidesmis sp. RL_2_1]